MRSLEIVLTSSILNKLNSHCRAQPLIKAVGNILGIERTRNKTSSGKCTLTHLRCPYNMTLEKSSGPIQNRRIIGKLPILVALSAKRLNNTILPYTFGASLLWSSIRIALKLMLLPFYKPYDVVFIEYPIYASHIRIYLYKTIG